jgi:predicted nucleic acid-binding protein
MNVKCFVDTNVLVYAYDRGAGPRHDRAVELLEFLWREGTGILSTQVLQEFYVNVRRKARKPVSARQAKNLIADYLAWDPVINDAASILDAIEIEQKHKVSFWDAMIVAAAQRAEASTLYSEDFNHGQSFGAVTVVNPFLD